MARPRRYTKVDKEQKARAEEIMVGLWKRAAKGERVEISYKDEALGNFAKRKLMAQRMHEQLANHRAKLKRKPLQNLEMMQVFDNVALRKPDEFTIVLEFNPAKTFAGVNEVLRLTSTNPGLVNS